MANKLRIATRNCLDKAYLICADTTNKTISKSVSTLPASNLKNILKARVLRSIDTTNVAIYGVLPILHELNCVLINHHNLTEDTEIDITFYSDIDHLVEISGSAVNYIVEAEESATANTLSPTNIAIWFTEVTGVKSFKIDITNGVTDPLTYFQIGNIFMSKYIESNYNISIGSSIYWKESTEQKRTDSGSLTSNPSNKVKVLNFSIDAIEESQRSNIFRDLSDSGLQKPLFISVYPESLSTTQKMYDYMGLVKATKSSAYTEYANNIYKSTYTFEEV